MNEETQRRIFDYFQKNGIKRFLGVPDSTLKYFIDQGLEKKKILIATREEEAIGIATGMTLSGSKCLVFMQNAGFANSISTITSLVQLYRIPLIFMIGWRGYLSTDAPEHIHVGKIQQDLLDLVKLKSKVILEQSWKNDCRWALQNLEKNKSCALIVKRESND